VRWQVPDRSLERPLKSLPAMFADAVSSARPCRGCAGARRTTMLLRLARDGDWYACPVCDARP